MLAILDGQKGMTALTPEMVIAYVNRPQPIVLVLPEPPAANRYLRTHGHVTYKTREAKAYCELIATLANECRVDGGPAFPTGDVSVRVVWYRSRKAGDLGERTKCLYDSLQGTVYTDDKQIAHDERWRVDAHPTIPKGHVRVEVSAL
jgi:Holliday junction resolvase RusA-like endonuclease